MSGTLPITAIVASHDEAHLLPACLAGVSFCDEVVVIDVASTDNTREVAVAHGARVVEHEWVPIAELARARAIAEARHDWLLVRDPDEVIPPALAAHVAAHLAEWGEDVAVVAAPIQRYFRGRPLRGGVWGGVKVDRLLARRSAVEFPTGVNQRLKRKPGYRDVTIEPTGDNVIAHHWLTGYRSFFEKHRRYLSLEGRDRADQGQVTGWRRVLATAPRSFHESFVRQHGHRDGVLGLVLSVLWAWYQTSAELALLRELRRRRAGAAGG